MIPLLSSEGVLGMEKKTKKQKRHKSEKWKKKPREKDPLESRKEREKKITKSSQKMSDPKKIQESLESCWYPQFSMR